MSQSMLLLLVVVMCFVMAVLILLRVGAHWATNPADFRSFWAEMPERIERLVRRFTIAVLGGQDRAGRDYSRIKLH